MEYFINWMIIYESSHLNIIMFLKYYVNLSDTNSKDSPWFETFDIMQQEAVPTTNPIFKDPDAATTFLGKERGNIKCFVGESEQKAMVYTQKMRGIKVLKLGS